ncbi:MAG: lipid-A-disaccharide synthase [bacterium]|nr:lipid-A-disaccharide synthase [bacterium]MDT8365308.1 lipid-A-disaccharide synthase [bacterium]
MARSLMIVAGEVSGDMYGGRLAKALQALEPGIKLAGIGGDRMAEAGVDLQVHISDLSVMGIWEVVRDMGRLRKILDEAKESMRKSRPDGLVLIDFYRFNIELAKEAKRLGIPVVYYVAPKLWVWGKGRIKYLRKYVDHILAIFPFEEEFFRSLGMPVSYVGNPLAEILGDSTAEAPLLKKIEGETVVSLLPGSRTSEVRQLLPHFLKAAQLISRELEGKVRFYLPLPQTISITFVESMLAQASIEVTVIAGRSREVLRISDISLVSSGTATLEAFLLGIPQVVAYRTSWLTYFLGKRIVKIDRFSLPNILAGRDVVEELLQEEVIPERLARAGLRILEEGPARAEYLRAGREVLGTLQGDQASRLAAQKTLEIVSGAMK